MKKTRGKPRPNDENPRRSYKGYDENKTINNPAYQSYYDVDENDSNQRLVEYSDWIKTGNGNKK